MSEDRPQDNLTVRRVTEQANPVLTALSICEDAGEEGDYIYLDFQWVRKAAEYGIGEMQVDLFQRHSDFEPAGIVENWVSSVLLPNKGGYWCCGSIPVVPLYYVDKTEVRRFEQFCRAYAVMMPGKDLLLPTIFGFDELQLTDATPPKLSRLIKEVREYGQGRFRIIGAKVLKHGTDEWTAFCEDNKGAIERRGNV